MRKFVGVFAAGLVLGTALGVGASGWRRSHAPTASVDAGSAGHTRAQAEVAGRALAQGDRPPKRSLDDDIARLRRWVEGDESELTRAAAGEIAKRWAAVDPRAALDFVAQAKRFPNRNEALVAPLAALAKQNVREAIEWLQKYGTESERGEVAERAIRLMLGDAPDAALELAFADHVPVDVHSFGDILSALVKLAPDRALRGFARLSQSGQRMVAQRFAAAYYGRDPAAAMAWLTAQDSTPCHSEAVKGVLLGAASASDAAGLRTLIDQLKPAPGDIRYLLMAAGKVSAQNELVVLQALGGEDRRLAVQYFVRQNFEGSPENMVQLVKSLLPPDSQGAALQDGFRFWLRSDRSAALGWLASLQDPVITPKLQTVVNLAQARENPEDYLKLAEAQPAETSDPEGLRDALMSCAESRPASAAGWVSRNFSKVDPAAVAMIASEYIGRDQVAGAAWIASLPKGPLQDRALQAAVDHWSRAGDLPKATDSVNGITDPAQKIAALYSVFSSVARKDQAAALRWAEEQGISEETRVSWVAISSGDHSVIFD